MQELVKKEEKKKSKDMSNFSFYSHLSVKRPASTHISPLYVMHSHKWETVCD